MNLKRVHHVEASPKEARAEARAIAKDPFSQVPGPVSYLLRRSVYNLPRNLHIGWGNIGTPDAQVWPALILPVGDGKAWGGAYYEYMNVDYFTPKDWAYRGVFHGTSPADGRPYVHVSENGPPVYGYELAELLACPVSGGKILLLDPTVGPVGARPNSLMVGNHLYAEDYWRLAYEMARCAAKRSAGAGWDEVPSLLLPERGETWVEQLQLDRAADLEL